MSNRPKLHVHLFTNDLNPEVLSRIQLLKKADYFVGVFLLDNLLVDPVPQLPFRRAGLIRMSWLRESLRELQAILRTEGSELRISKHVLTLLSEWNQQYQLTISINDEPATDEQHRLDELKRTFGNCIETIRYGFLLNETQLATLPAKISHTFTTFRFAVEQAKFRVEVPKPLTSLPPVPPELKCATIKSAKNSKMIAPTIPFEPGCLSAQRKLETYFSQQLPLSKYKATRNGLLGFGYSSGFSVYLANGALDVRVLWYAIEDYETRFGTNEGSYWLKVELLWREYFRWQGVWQGKRLFIPEGYRTPAKLLQNTRDVMLFQAWCAGNTGQSFVDACMTELRTTGFLSNRGRQNAASYLIHDLGIDWRWGAWWFQHALIDFDVYSNQGNWQYIAGVGCDPKGGRHFDVVQQANWYDPDGAYIGWWSTD
jgi:deoxyribodipyrimidine photo-lyase